jgi:hypothetical protein
MTVFRFSIAFPLGKVPSACEADEVLKPHAIAQP